MMPRFEEFELTESAYRHGFDDEDFGEMLRGPHIFIRSRRGKRAGYEILGLGGGGVYLLAAARVVQGEEKKRLRVFHVNLMTAAEKRRFRRMVQR